MAQWASTRPDVFPPRLIDKIVCLQDDVKVSHSLATVEHTLEEAFGPDWKNQLDLDPNPLGAGCNSSNEQPLITLMLLFYLGSVAQVFKGTLKPSNSTQQKAVAIKMIHPHVESMVKTDMELLSYIASIMDKVPSLEILSLGETMRQFADAMNNQLDLRLEARNLICELLFFFSFSRFEDSKQYIGAKSLKILALQVMLWPLEISLIRIYALRKNSTSKKLFTKYSTPF
jgi:aarF domain-containing kinase